MKLSNLHNVYISRDFNNKPYRIDFYVDITGDTYVVHIEKWEGQWRVHYAAHWVENCKYCNAKVRLDSDCEPITANLRENFDELMEWLGEQRKADPGLFK